MSSTMPQRMRRSDVKVLVCQAYCYVRCFQCLVDTPGKQVKRFVIIYKYPILSPRVKSQLLIVYTASGFLISLAHVKLVLDSCNLPSNISDSGVASNSGEDFAWKISIKRMYSCSTCNDLFIYRYNYVIEWLRSRRKKSQNYKDNLRELKTA